MSIEVPQGGRSLSVLPLIAATTFTPPPESAITITPDAGATIDFDTALVAVEVAQCIAEHSTRPVDLGSTCGRPDRCKTFSVELEDDFYARFVDYNEANPSGQFIGTSLIEISLNVDTITFKVDGIPFESGSAYQALSSDSGLDGNVNLVDIYGEWAFTDSRTGKTPICMTDPPDEHCDRVYNWGKRPEAQSQYKRHLLRALAACRKRKTR
jgi:hypothetical protein